MKHAASGDARPRSSDAIVAARPGVTTAVSMCPIKKLMETGFGLIASGDIGRVSAEI